MYVETKSYYDSNGKIKYVDMRRGKSGEYGPFQMTRVAWRQIHKRGEPFWALETNTTYAEILAKRYLVWLYTNYSNNWNDVIQMYNAGPNNTNYAYLQKVLKAAK